MLTHRLCRILGLLAIVVTFTLISYLGIYQRNLSNVPGKYRNFDDTSGGKCLKNYFQDVLLVVVYHYQFYSTVPFVLSQYENAFPHIVVCGPKPSTDFEILAVDMGPKGYYCYECLGKVIRSYPDFRGYLFVNDDMVVNWWNFAKLDKDKIWNGAKIDNSVAHEINRRPVRDDWMWWKKEHGLKNCEKTYRQLVGFANGSLPRADFKKLLLIHYLNGNNRTMCFRTWSDFVYVPGRFAKEFEKLSRIFFENEVFLEIAFPTILSLLDDRKSWEDVKGVYLPDVFGFQDFSNAKYVWPQFSEETIFLHPVKFAGNRGFKNRKIFKSRVLPYVEHYTSC